MGRGGGGENDGERERGGETDRQRQGERQTDKQTDRGRQKVRQEQGIHRERETGFLTRGVGKRQRD